ncbi:MAG: hypothetical protein JNL26_06455 [Gemmatimonadetes bacterium]|nr:hypothetical protein [Gemmatimonadota bacterium]
MDQLTNEKLHALYRTAVAQGLATRGAHVSPDRLHDLVARRGSESQRLADLDHVMSCAPCREGYELLRAVDAAQEHGIVRRRWVPLAAAAALLLAVGVLTLRPRPEPEVPVLRDGGSVPAAVSPVGAVVADAARTYTWRAVPTATRYDFALLDAAGTPVHTAATGDTTYTLPLTVPLAPGEYQWVVSAALPQGAASVAPVQSFRVQ